LLDFCYLVGGVVYFDKRLYSVNESDREVQPRLILNREISNDVTITVMDNEDTAISKSI